MNFGLLLKAAQGATVLRDFYQEFMIKKRLRAEAKRVYVFNRIMMLSLVIWASFMLLMSSILYVFSEKMLVYFLQLTIIFSLVELAFGISGYYRQIQKEKDLAKESDPITALSIARKKQDKHALQTGVAFAIMAIALWLIDRGAFASSQMFTGFGAALLLQGIFLACFNWILFALNRKQTESLLDIQKLS